MNSFDVFVIKGFTVAVWINVFVIKGFTVAVWINVILFGHANNC